MQSVIVAYKPVGATPLQVIQGIKRSSVPLEGKKLGYAGRLDPMAEGVLLILVGEENKRKHVYEQLDKIYECEALLGVSTDTFDVLGVLDSSIIKNIPSGLGKKIDSFFAGYLGSRQQRYPPYSSFRTHGKPLFYWARKNQLNDKIIPTHTITVFEIRLEGIEDISLSAAEEKVFSKIRKITQGDFRQEQIKEAWTRFFSQHNSQTSLPLISFTVHCSAGTYVRALVCDLGQYLGTGAICFSLKRTSVGKYTAQNAEIFQDC